METVEHFEIKAWGAVPDKAQFAYHKEELAAFVHFGLNTFTGVEWGDCYGDTPLSELFLLKQPFDAETLMSVLKEAGFKKIIITAKHHDGFALWNSQYTDYDIANTCYKQGTGDILAEISAAATKYNINMGLYLSPWDIHDKSYGYYDENGNPLVGEDGEPLNNRTWAEVEVLDAQDYNEFYNQQLVEILSNPKYGNNGRFNEIWMDGAKAAGAKVQHYDFVRWYNTIQNYQGKVAGYEADVMLFNAGEKTAIRWIGNEEGISPETHWATTNYTYDSKGNINGFEHTNYQGVEGGSLWTVPEADARITSGWFWGENKKTPKSIKELANIYFKSIGRNSTLLLNIPPNTNGTLDQAILERVREFGNNIRETFANNLAKNSLITANSTYAPEYSVLNLLNDDTHSIWAAKEGESCSIIQIDLRSLKNFDVVSIEEAIQLGQRITSFCIEVSKDGEIWQEFAIGTTVGGKRLVRKHPVNARFLKLTVDTNSDVKQGIVPVLSGIGIFKASRGFSLGEVLPQGVEVIDIHQYKSTCKDTNRKGSVLQFDFYGSGIILVGTFYSNISDVLVTIDNIERSISFNQERINEMYRFTDLEHGYHNVRIEIKSSTASIESIYAINNDGRGLFEFVQEEYVMDKDSTMTVKVQRIGGSKGCAFVDVQANPMTAMQYHFDPDSGGRIVFEDGEIEKTVEVKTKFYEESREERYFELDFGEPKGANIGFIDRTRIYIR